MLSRKLSAFTFLTVSALSCLPVQCAESFEIVRLGEKAAVFKIGRYDATNVIVLAAKRGLAVVDTGILPSQAIALRTAIEREFGRKDFALVINTHSHFDHSDGNQAFTDVPIVAHQNAPSEMRRYFGTPEAIGYFLGSRRQYASELERDLKAAPAGSTAAARLREQADENAAVIEDFQSGRLALTPPTITFSDRMTFDLGDLTLNLFYYGRSHTNSDILVEVPELRLLLTGDLFDKDWLPSFPRGAADVSRWLQTLSTVLDGNHPPERVVGGHRDEFSGAELRAKRDYIKDVWDAIASARKEGISLEATKERFAFETRYPQLKDWNHVFEGRDFHLSNLEAAWRLQSDSAASALDKLIRERGLEPALAEYRQSVASNPRYHVDERELNALGYRFLQEDRKTAEAIAVFMLNTEHFPQSWNVWDSLGEAYAWAEDNDQAEKCYEKSLTLNPQNENGKASLSRLAGSRLDARGETKSPPRYQRGQQTGIRGPYLGERPAGRRPKVFAPGIVSTAGNYEFSITFNPDGKEIYFTRRADRDGTNTIMMSRLEPDGWTAPQEASPTQGMQANEPHITPDGTKLYFGSRPPAGAGPPPGIWVSERTGGSWSQPRFHGPGMYASSSRAGNLYLWQGEKGIARFPYANGAFGPPELLPAAVNAPRPAVHGTIAPDESFLVFDSYQRPGSQGGEGDLFVSFRKADGTWSDAVNLGDAINTPATNFCPALSPDGKYLFFSTHRDIYWVDASVVHELRARAMR